jgi:hypothetical protein
MKAFEALVEATFSEIHLDAEERKIRIEIRSKWGGAARFRLLATGVDDFLANGLRLENIIDRVSHVSASNFGLAENGLAERLFFLLQQREARKSELEWDVLTDKLLRIQDGRLRFLEIEPVYGASVMILAERFELHAN